MSNDKQIRSDDQRKKTGATVNHGGMKDRDKKKDDKKKKDKGGK